MTPWKLSDGREVPAVIDHDRFWSKVEKSSGCWLWGGWIGRGGYGYFNTKDRRKALAHRLAYELIKGPIPDGCQLDHLCRNRACVNPDHLEAVTPQTNNRRGLKGALKTHCAQGHAYEGENVRIRPNGRRVCRICERLHSQAQTARRRDVKPLGSWRLTDGTSFPAAISHDYAQRELLHAQTPAVGRASYKRGLDSAQTAAEAAALFDKRADEYVANLYDADGVPFGRGDLITVTPRGPLCSALFQRYEAGELTRDELVAQWTAAWDADRAARR